MRRNVLFVCLENKDRSPTAKTVFTDMLARAGYTDVSVSSAGIEADDDGQQFETELADRYEEIFVLDSRVLEEVVLTYGQSLNKLVNLEIPDIYYRGHPKLVAELERKLSPYVHKTIQQVKSRK